MGQKVHPKIFRVGVIETWDSKWYAQHDYARLLHEDLKIKKFLKTRLYHAGISKIEVERAANKAKINIYTARPGIVIGKKGAEIEKLKQEIGRLSDREAYLNIIEKINCAYCSYANGLISFVREIASRTEQYWCPIKHARRVAGAHGRYSGFVDFGDAETFRRELARLRAELRQ